VNDDVADSWSLLTNGIADRPYISDYSVTTNGVSYTVWSGLASAASSPPSSLYPSTGMLYDSNMILVNQSISDGGSHAGLGALWQTMNG
jgi:hypothetical protein